MTARHLLQQVHALGVVFTLCPDGTLHYKAPPGVLSPALLDDLRQHREELLTLLEAFEERAAIAASCGGLAREEAEALAWACLFDEPAHAGCAACGYPDVAVHR